MKVIHIWPHNIEDFIATGYDSFDHHSIRFLTRVERFWRREHGDEPFEQELWVLSKNHETEFEVKHISGFLVRFFPISIKLQIPLEVSFPMIRAAWNNRSPRTLYHLHSYYLFMQDLLFPVLTIRRKKYLIHYHGGGPSWTLKATPYTLYHYLIGLRLTLNFAKTVIVQNKDEMRRVRKFLGVSRKKILYLPNTIAESSISHAPQKHERITIILAGRLGEKLREKEILFAIFKNVLAANAQCDIKFVGAKNTAPFESLIKAFPGRVFVDGWLPKKELLEAFGAADIYLHTNTKSEGSPAALIEAASRGAAVIAFDIDGVRDVVQNETSGMLVKTYSAFEHAIIALAGDRQKLQSFREKSIRNIKEHFTQEAHFPKLIALYSHCSAQS